jgi:hypothetical protein
MSLAQDPKTQVLVFDCARAILEGQERVTVSWDRGARPPGFPTGELLSVGTNGSRNHSVSPVRVLDWIHGRIVSERLAADGNLSPGSLGRRSTAVDDGTS